MVKLFTAEKRESPLHKKLSRIVGILVQGYRSDKIILFGSLVEGPVHEWSNIDLLLVKDTAKRSIERVLEVVKLVQPRVVLIFLFIPLPNSRWPSGRVSLFGVILSKTGGFFMKKETQEWVKIADEDLQSGECLLERKLYRMVCYHTQQAVEKIPKAVLGENGVEFPRTHHILDLCIALQKLEPSPF